MSESRYWYHHRITHRIYRIDLQERTPQLCSGATWHAAGLVTRFAGSSKLKKIHVRSLAILTALHDKYGIGLHTEGGSIRLVEKGNRDRWLEAQQQVRSGLKQPSVW